MPSFGDRLFQQAKEQSDRKKERSEQLQFTFSPKLTAAQPSENFLTERVSKSNAGNRLYQLSKQDENKRIRREEKRLQREVQNCTFEPAVTKKNHRPTKPIIPSSPTAFKRKVKQIFHTLDVDDSGTLSLRELKKGMIQIPALSEIIAPGRSLQAYINMSKETGSNPNSDEVTLIQFQSFCADATSLSHLNTFERRVGRIFEAMDLNQNGSISVKELKKGMIHIPELSELIAPKRFRDALNELQNSSAGAMDKNDFFTFCKKGASINHVVDTPERKSDRMYQKAKETLENRDRSHVLHIQKQAADIDAECTFVPLVNKNRTKKHRKNRKNRRNNNADDEQTASISSTFTSASASPASSRFEQLYKNGVQQRKHMDNIAIQQRKLAEKKIYEACSFSPKVNRSISTSTSTSSTPNSTFQPRPPTTGHPTKTKAIAASDRLYHQAVSRQQRVKERETHKLRLEGDQCTFHPEITEMGYESKGTKYRYGSLSALTPGVQSTGERLYGAGRHIQKKWDKVHADAETLCEGSMEDHYTFTPEILRKSKNIKNVKSFHQRLYDDQQKRKLREEKEKKLKQSLLTFTPRTNRTKKIKPKHYHASVSVQVPTNHFGLPGSNSSGSTGKITQKEKTDILWYCHRRPVPNSPRKHAVDMYKRGLQKMKEKDSKYLQKETNKDWSSCTFSPKINRSSNPRVRTSPPLPLNTTRNEDTKQLLITQVETKDMGCMAGVSMLSTTEQAAVKIQTMGRGTSDRTLFAKKRRSSIQIQKIGRGSSERKRYKKKINAFHQQQHQTEQRARKEQEIKIKEGQKVKEEGERKVEAVQATTRNIVAAGEVLQQQQAHAKKEQGKKSKTKGKKGKKRTKKAAKKKLGKGGKEEKKKHTVKKITEQEQRVMDLHSIIGMAYGSVVAYRKTEEKKNSISEPRMNFLEWYTTIHVLVHQCEKDQVLCDKYIYDLKVQIRKHMNDSKRIFWFGSMLGWIPKTEAQKKTFPFSHDAASAYIDILNKSGIVSSYEYESNNAASFTSVGVLPLLCKSLALVNGHALATSIEQFFETTGNAKDVEVVDLLKALKKNVKNGQIDLYASMDLFLECWYAVVGRFKAAWGGDDDVPVSPTEKVITPG